jgi:hypothetical protein
MVVGVRAGATLIAGPVAGPVVDDRLAVLRRELVRAGGVGERLGLKRGRIVPLGPVAVGVVGVDLIPVAAISIGQPVQIS